MCRHSADGGSLGRQREFLVCSQQTLSSMQQKQIRFLQLMKGESKQCNQKAPEGNKRHQRLNGQIPVQRHEFAGYAAAIQEKLCYAQQPSVFGSMQRQQDFKERDSA